MALVNVSTTLFAPPPPTPTTIELLEPVGVRTAAYMPTTEPEFGDDDNDIGLANETATSSPPGETTTTFVPYMGKDKLTAEDAQMDATLLKSNEPNAPPAILPPPPMPPPPPPLCTGWTCNSRFHSVTGRGTSHHRIALTHEQKASIHQTRTWLLHPATATMCQTERTHGCSLSLFLFTSEYAHKDT